MKLVRTAAFKAILAGLVLLGSAVAAAQVALAQSAAAAVAPSFVGSYSATESFGPWTSAGIPLTIEAGGACSDGSILTFCGWTQASNVITVMFFNDSGDTIKWTGSYTAFGISSPEHPGTANGDGDLGTFYAQRLQQATITTTSLPTATVGVPYYFQLQATGGTLPYTWTKDPPEGGGGPPFRLHLSRSGLISGTPKKAGTYTITVKCFEASHPAKSRATQQLTLIVDP